jgi:hypothetical protein
MEGANKVLEQMAKKAVVQPCGCTADGDPIQYNPWNKVVQCHKCGAKYKLVASNNKFNRTALRLPVN